MRTLRASPERFQRLWIAGLAVFGTIGVLVWLAWTGHNPFSRLEGEGGGVGQYATGELWRSLPWFARAKAPPADGQPAAAPATEVPPSTPVT